MVPEYEERVYLVYKHDVVQMPPHYSGGNQIKCDSFDPSRTNRLSFLARRLPCPCLTTHIRPTNSG